MVDSFITILLSVFIGYLFSYFYKDREKFESSINDYLYYLALPLTIFLKTFTSNISDLTLNIFLINSIPLVFIYILIYVFYTFNFFTPSFTRTLIITSTLGNVVYLGFNVVSLLYQEEAIATAAISITVQNLIIFTFGVLFLNFICYEKSCMIISVKKSFLNPIFISSFSGVVFNLLNFKLPHHLYIMLEQIVKTTLPLSLFLIGVSLYGKKLNTSYMKKIFIIFFFKSIILPFIAFLFIYLYGRFDIYSSVAFTLYTMPVAVAAYVVAKEFELEVEVVGGAVFFTTVFYFILYWVYIYILKLFL